MFTMDDYRQNGLLQKVETTTQQDRHSRPTMGLHETSPSDPLYSRTPPNLPLPPYGGLSRHANIRSPFPLAEHHNPPSPPILHHRRRLALFRPPPSAPPPPLQTRPQSTPRVLSPLRSCCRIRPSCRDFDSGGWDCVGSSWILLDQG